MSILDKKIENYIFGDISTNELLSLAFEKKLKHFGSFITYSPKVFIPLTTLCQDSCAYCTFVKSPKDGGAYLTHEEVDAIANVGDKSGCFEALFTLGDKPEAKWSFAIEELQKLGYDSTFSYLLENAKRVNENYHLFPHINPGLMSNNEIKQYKKYSPSGGLMIETFSNKLTEKGRAHYGAKTKNVSLRLNTLQSAMDMKYPMTTGLLLGIADTKDEIVFDIFQLIETCNKNKAIQEIILQNFRAKQNTIMRNNSEIINDLFLRIIATTRIFLPGHISLQIPPNLVSDVRLFLKSGINDFGGISPKTIDWVNPDHNWPNIENLKILVEENDQKLYPRLPVYPSFIDKEWLSPGIYEKVLNSVNESGYPKKHELIQ